MFMFYKLDDEGRAVMKNWILVVIVGVCIVIGITIARVI